MSRKWQNIIINWSIEFGPIAIFFSMLAFAGETERAFVIATGIFTVTTVIALMAAYIREKRIALFAAIAGTFIVGFGVATVYFDDPHLFMIKDTAYNGFLAIFLLPGLLVGKGNLKHLFEGLFDLKEEGWFKLSLHYFILFVCIAVANEFIWRNLSQTIWIISKYVATGATVGLGFCEIPLGKKYRNPSASAWGVKVTSKADDRLHIHD